MALLELRSKLVRTINRLPRYMCTESIDRTVFRPVDSVAGSVVAGSCDDSGAAWRETKLRKLLSDRLRLDVAVSSHSEMFSWAGENGFHDRRLAELVQGGATSTGAFASFLSSVFGSNAANFTFEGEDKTEGRTLERFGFRVPLENSGYTIGVKPPGTIVPYHGTFLVDAGSVSLRELTVVADQVPADINVCSSTTTLTYTSPVKLNGSEFVLPASARLHVVRTNGTELDNRTAFSGCHEFLGESSLNFNMSETQAQGRQMKPPQPLELPAGIDFKFSLREPIYTADAAAGDTFSATLRSDIKQRDRGIVVPKGSPITGRIVRMQRFYGPRFESLRLGLRLESVRINGNPQPFPARTESMVVNGNRKGLGAGRARSNELGSFAEMSDPDSATLSYFVLDDVTSDYVLHRGLVLEGVTVANR